MPRSHMPCGQPKFSSIPSAPAIGGALHEIVPVLARVDHERGDDGVIRPTLFHFRDLAEVGLGRAVADQLDVVQADHAHVAVVDRGVARGDIEDRVADRFPDDAAPAGFEGAMGLVSGVAGRPGGDPERVRGLIPARLVERSAIVRLLLVFGGQRAGGGRGMGRGRELFVFRFQLGDADRVVQTGAKRHMRMPQREG